MSRVFISYRRHPSAMLAQLLATNLPKHGVTAFVDTREVGGSGLFPQRLLKAIDDADIFICLLAESTLDSDWVRREIRYAYERGKPMIPVFQESYTPPSPNQSLDESMVALLTYDAIHIFDQKAVMVDQSIAELAQMVKGTKTHTRRGSAAACRRITLMLLLIAVGLMLALGLANILTNTPPSIATPTSTLPLLGYSLVSRVTANDQWSPIIEEFNGVEMVLVPSGCFTMGSTEEQIEYAVELGIQRLYLEDEQPTTELCFGQPFWIDRFEVTNALAGGMAGRPSNFSGAGQPRERITWFEARNFCGQRGARLPTEAEWEYAARGPDNLIFPWGDVFIVENAVWAKNSERTTQNVGSRPAGASWVGAQDMSGNVWEWTASEYRDYPYIRADGREINSNSTGIIRVARGGSWLEDDAYLRTTNRYRLAPEFTGYNIGFRCVRDYED